MATSSQTPKTDLDSNLVSVASKEAQEIHPLNYSKNKEYSYSKTDETVPGDKTAVGAVPPPPSPPVFKFSSLPRRGKCVLILCTLVTFLAGCAFSLLVPFYSLSAVKKGMSQTLIGFVFGVFELVIFLFSPLVGNYLTKIGPKFVQLSGVFVAGISVILFGVLDKCPSGLSFAVISIIVRSVKALGCASFITASYTIVSSEFPDFIGTVLGILETGTGAGFLLGPSIGGALYELGGYGLPFYCTGGLILLNGVFLYHFLPRPQVSKQKRIDSILCLLRVPKVLVLMGGVFMGGFGIGTFDSSFARHMEALGMSSGIIALYFAIGPAVVAMMAPLLGYLVDTKHILAPLIIWGHIGYCLCFLISGPSFFLTLLQHNLYTLIAGLCLAGLSVGCCLIPSITGMVEGAVESGYKNDIDTLARVSGLFTSVKSLGAFAGPIVSGAILDNYGYRIGYTVVGFLHIAWAFVPALFFGLKYFKKRKGSSNYENLTDQ